MGKKNGLKRYEEPQFLKKLAKDISQCSYTEDEDITENLYGFKSVPKDKRQSVLEAARSIKE